MAPEPVRDVRLAHAQVAKFAWTSTNGTVKGQDESGLYDVLGQIEFLDLKNQ